MGKKDNVLHGNYKISIILNGKNLEWFSPSRGICQGNAISPYLFVLCMERLEHLIDEVVLDDKWTPIKLTLNGPPLSHLFFADDLSLFAEASTN